MTKNCAFCGNEFTPQAERVKYCSRACYDKGRKISFYNKWETKKCRCGNEFRALISRKKYNCVYRHSIFCSRPCADKYKYEDRYEDVSCQYCGKGFRATKDRLLDNRGKYCSKICAYKGRIKHERVCPRCEEIKLVKDFRGGYCKRCHSEWQKENCKIFIEKYGISLSVYRRGRSVETFIDHLHQKAKKRAKVSNLDFAITKDFLIKLYDDQDGKCAITNLPLTHKTGNGRVGNNISIDRIDSNLGYTEANVWLVCAIVNRMKVELPLQNFIDYCEAVVRYSKPQIFIERTENAKSS